MKLGILLVVAMVFPAVAFAQERTFTAEGGGTSAQCFGEIGGWLVQSQERWDGILEMMKKIGTKTDDKLGKIDFAKENILCIFHHGDEGDRFSLHKLMGNEKSREAQIVMSYIIYKQRPNTPLMWKLYAVPILKTDETIVTVSTYHPMNGGPYPTPDKAKLEWKWTFSAKTGESVGGLGVQMEAKAAKIRPGEDILLKVKLAATDAVKEAGAFVRQADAPVFVWDNKYSEGYRNDAYEVVLPDGTIVVVRSAVINEWRKNVPHPVEIKAGKPYELVNWVEGNSFKSLKERGLDTSKPGKYAVTCIYQERGSESGRGTGTPMWGGMVRGNTVVVEVGE